MVIVLYSAPSFLHLQMHVTRNQSEWNKAQPQQQELPALMFTLFITLGAACLKGLSIWKINDKLFENCFDYIFLR